VFRLTTSSYLVGVCTGKSAGCLALEDAIDLPGRLSILIDRIGPVGHQAGGGRIRWVKVNRRQLMLCCERDDELAMHDHRSARCHDQPALCRPGEISDAALPAGWAESRRTATRVTPGVDLFHQLQPLRANTVFREGKTGRIAARSRQARDELSTDRVRNQYEHNRAVWVACCSSGPT
jgi:hypothetical protein